MNGMILTAMLCGAGTPNDSLAPTTYMLAMSAATAVPPASPEPVAAYGDRALICWVNGYTCAPCEVKLQDCEHFRTNGSLFGVQQPAAVVVRRNNTSTGITMTVVAASTDAYPQIRAALTPEIRTPYAASSPAVGFCYEVGGCPPQSYGRPAGYAAPMAYACGPNGCGPVSAGYGAPFAGGQPFYGAGDGGGCASGNCGGMSAGPPSGGGGFRGGLFRGGFRGGRVRGGGGCSGGGCGG